MTGAQAHYTGNRALTMDSNETRTSTSASLLLASSHHSIFYRRCITMYTHVDQQLAAPSVCTRPLRHQCARAASWLFASMGPGFGLEESSGPPLCRDEAARGDHLALCRRSRRFDLHLDLVILHLVHTGSCGSHVSASVCLLSHTCMLVNSWYPFGSVLVGRGVHVAFDAHVVAWC